MRPLLVAAAVLLAGCAGQDTAAVKGPPRDVGHGSVEEVGEALQAQGVPCRDPKPVALPPGTEQAVECVLGRRDEKVLLVHFFDIGGAQAFEKQTRDAGDHGVFADTWAARTETAEAAELIAMAIENRGAA